jgi:uncharacterized protein YjiK
VRRSAALAAAIISIGAGSAAARGADSVLGRYDLHDPADRWRLPKALNEVSGLAPEGHHLLAHGDEQAIVYELDPATHVVVGHFSLGQPAVRGDFEAIALVAGRVFLTTSDGDLYAARRGANGEAVSYQRYVTGIGRSCEVEGLAYDERSREFLFSCKTPRVQALSGKLAVFGWSPERPGPPVLRLRIPTAGISGIGDEPVHPSELWRDAASGHLLLLAARAHVIVEVTRDGQVVRVAKLRGSLHRQAEGLAIGSDGSLYVSDEAEGQYPTLTRYGPR